MKDFWGILGRTADALAVLTTLGAVVIWVLAREKLIGPAHERAYTTAAIAVISVVGVGCVVGGFIMRRNGDIVFTPNRGRVGTTAILLGVVLMAVAIVGLVVI